MQPSLRALSERSESDHEGRWSVECQEGDGCLPVSRTLQKTHGGSPCRL